MDACTPASSQAGRRCSVDKSCCCVLWCGRVEIVDLLLCSGVCKLCETEDKRGGRERVGVRSSVFPSFFEFVPLSV